jgi:hypothetical protein
MKKIWENQIKLKNMKSNWKTCNRLWICRTWELWIWILFMKFQIYLTKLLNYIYQINQEIKDDLWNETLITSNRHERITSAHARSLYANTPNTSSCYCKLNICKFHFHTCFNNGLHKMPKLRVSSWNLKLINTISLSHKSIPTKLFVYSEIKSISFHTKTILNYKKTFWYAHMHVLQMYTCTRHIHCILPSPVFRNKLQKTF